ncbi:transposase [Paenibacillus polymyxa]|nr:transposase [Paenibacillus polymyxa]URJ62774.1 transposase [Paenibacillus polymyxa]
MELSAKLNWYEEQFRLAKKKRFGASSEQTHPDQLEFPLFNEAEMIAALYRLLSCYDRYTSSPNLRVVLGWRSCIYR